ncbi:MAG TPA: HipA family kinase [Thermoanaerobaculia bacterium]|nr:HipA family kinase [Thermoanaerobaculia bacterium]
MIRTVTATEYVTPLREGGSLPAIVDGDDDGTYVVKFRGAGQGVRALVAELVSGEIGRALGLPVPEIVLVQLDGRIAKTEPDAEIQELLGKSEGLNIGLDYLPGSITFDPLIDRPMHGKERLASSIVWFDALVTNVDRTPKNTNLLVWHKNLWMIDHSATLIFHHNWSDDVLKRSGKPFPQIKHHVLLRWASQIRKVDDAMAAMLTGEVIHRIVQAIPDDWLGDEPRFASVKEHRAAYRDYLLQRLETPRHWMEDAADAQALSV